MRFRIEIFAECVHGNGLIDYGYYETLAEAHKWATYAANDNYCAWLYIDGVESARYEITGKIIVY